MAGVRPALCLKNRCWEQVKLAFLNFYLQCFLYVIVSQPTKMLEFTYFIILADISTNGKMKFRLEFGRQDLLPHFYLFFGQSLIKKLCENTVLGIFRKSGVE